MKLRSPIIIVIIVILVIAGFFLYAAGPGPFTLKAPGDARESIRQFIGNPMAVVIFDEHNTNFIGEAYDTYRVDRDRFTVDPGTGAVTGAFFFSVPMTENKTLTLQEAAGTAKEFAASHYNNFNSRNMQLTEAKMLDHGAGGIEYSYTWSEQSMNISLGNAVHVSVNTDGRILSYNARDTIAPKVEPARIGKDPAVETATRYVITATKITNITSNETSALLTVMPDNQNRVVWKVDLELRFLNPDIGIEDHRGGLVYVDAMTGDVVKYEPCM